MRLSLTLTGLLLLLACAHTGCDLLADLSDSPDLEAPDATVTTRPDAGHLDQGAANDQSSSFLDTGTKATPWAYDTHRKRVRFHVPPSLPHTFRDLPISLTLDDRSGVDPRDVHAMGHDLKVTDDQGLPLVAEIEPNGKIGAPGWRVWFRAPELRAGSAFWLYYSHPFTPPPEDQESALVWPERYLRVYHGAVSNQEVLDSTAKQGHARVLGYPGDMPRTAVIERTTAEADFATSLVFGGQRNLEISGLPSPGKGDDLDLLPEGALTFLIVFKDMHPAEQLEGVMLFSRVDWCVGYTFAITPIGQTFWDIWSLDPSRPNRCQGDVPRISRILPNRAADYIVPGSWNMIVAQIDREAEIQQNWNNAGLPLPKIPQDFQLSRLKDIAHLSTSNSAPLTLGCISGCKDSGLPTTASDDQRAAARRMKRFHGLIDEFHILDAPVDAPWVNLQYEAIRGNLFVFDPPETHP